MKNRKDCIDDVKYGLITKKVGLIEKHVNNREVFPAAPILNSTKGASWLGFVANWIITAKRPLSER